MKKDEDKRIQEAGEYKCWHIDYKIEDELDFGTLQHPAVIPPKMLHVVGGIFTLDAISTGFACQVFYKLGRYDRL